MWRCSEAWAQERAWVKLTFKKKKKEKKKRDFLGGPVVCNVGHLGLIPGQGTRSHTLQLRLSAAK